MIEAGLLVTGDDIPVPYDRFRDRVMFPITDLRGRVIAFGGRALEKDAPAKYLNSPETPLFHKGATLYNGAAARKAAHQGAPIVVVEGYVDVIAHGDGGLPGAVAPLGTALTEDQLALLWKMADEPVLCFDGDGAGRRAAYRAVDLALPHIKPGKSVQVRAAARGAGPGRSGALGRARGDRRGDRRRAAARRHAVAARDRGRRVRHAGAARRARASRRRGRPTRSANQAVRKYYRQDLDARVRDAVRAARARPRTAAGQATQGRFGERGRLAARALAEGQRRAARAAGARRARGSRQARSCAARAARCRRARR